MKKRINRKKRSPWQESLAYLKEARNYIYFVVILFFISTIIGFAFPGKFVFFNELLRDLSGKIVINGANIRRSVKSIDIDIINAGIKSRRAGDKKCVGWNYSAIPSDKGDIPGIGISLACLYSGYDIPPSDSCRNSYRTKNITLS